MCCEGGGSCLKGYNCEEIDGIRGCCPKGETCVVAETLSEIEEFTQITGITVISTEISETTETTESASTSTADCTGPTITFYNFTVSSTYILQYDCSCPAFESEGEGPTTTQQTTIGMTCTITIPLSSSSASATTPLIFPTQAVGQSASSSANRSASDRSVTGPGLISILLPVLAGLIGTLIVLRY